MTGRKQCLWRHLKRFPENQVLRAQYRQICAEYKLAIRQFELYKEQKVIDAGNSGQFLANVLRYVHYMLSAVRLSVVCLLSVTLVHPTQAVELFGNFFSPYDSPGTLLFWCQKSLVGDTPFPLKFAFKVTHPL